MKNWVPTRFFGRRGSFLTACRRNANLTRILHAACKNEGRQGKGIVQGFISEDDLQTFEGWLKYQAVDTSTESELTMWRSLFEEARQRSATSPKVGLMKLQSVPGEHRYAVAVEDGAELWLTLWVRR